MLCHTKIKSLWSLTARTSLPASLSTNELWQMTRWGWLWILNSNTGQQQVLDLYSNDTSTSPTIHEFLIRKRYTSRSLSRIRMSLSVELRSHKQNNNVHNTSWCVCVKEKGRLHERRTNVKRERKKSWKYESAPAVFVRKLTIFAGQLGGFWYDRYVYFHWAILVM